MTLLNFTDRRTYVTNALTNEVLSRLTKQLMLPLVAFTDNLTDVFR